MPSSKGSPAPRSSAAASAAIRSSTGSRAAPSYRQKRCPGTRSSLTIGPGWSRRVPSADEPGDGVATGLQWPERLPVRLDLADDGLAAVERVHDDVVDEQDQRVETPARDVRLPVEAKRVQPEVGRAIALHVADVPRVAIAGLPREQAFADPAVELLRRHAAADRKAQDDVRVGEQRDVGVREWVDVGG